MKPFEGGPGGAVAKEQTTGRFVGTGELTDRQRTFVRLITENSLPPPKAAEVAGFEAQYSWVLMRNPNVLAEIRATTERILHGEGAPKAMRFLINVLDDKGFSGSARVQAAKYILDAAGHGVRASDKIVDPNDKPMEQWTLAELDAFISRQGAQLVEVKAQQDAIPGEAHEIARTPDATPEKA